MRRAFASTAIAGTVELCPLPEGDLGANHEAEEEQPVFMCYVTSDLEEGVSGSFEVRFRVRVSETVVDFHLSLFSCGG